MTIEQIVKSQFAKVFVANDWKLFKKVADANLREATVLLKSDMPIEPDLQLLARNSRKRLLIDVGVELLLKAVYLKQGYAINFPPKGSLLKFPFLIGDAKNVTLNKDNTFKLNDLIENLSKVVQLKDKNLTLIRTQNRESISKQGRARSNKQSSI